MIELEEQLIKKIETEFKKRGFDATNSDFDAMVKHTTKILALNLSAYENKGFDTEPDLWEFVNNKINKAVDSYLYESYSYNCAKFNYPKT